MIANIIFILGILCELVVSFSGYLGGGYHEEIIILLGMVLFSVKILMTMNLKKDWPIFLVTGIYGLLCFKFQGSALVLRLILIILAGRDQDAKKISKIFFYGTLITMVVAAVLATQLHLPRQPDRPDSVRIRTQLSAFPLHAGV